MPVAQHSGQHHHHSSLFSSIGSFFHVLQSSSHGFDASAPCFSSSPPSSSFSGHGSNSEAYETFEADLAQRLSLLLPVDGEPCVNLATLKQAMDVVLATQAGLKALVPRHVQQGYVAPRQDKMLEEFLERSVRMLDVCRVIKEQVEEVEGLKGWLQMVIELMMPESVTRGQMRRARKALTGLMNVLTQGDNKDADSHHDLQSHSHVHVRDVQVHGHTHRRSSSRAGDELHEPQRWVSWHGSPLIRRVSSRFSSASLYTERQLAAVAASLTPPKHSCMDGDESFSAAVYSFNVLCIFFLSTVLSSLPCPERRNHVLCFNHPRFFMWASPLTHLQERVQEELRTRLRRGGYGGLYELDQIGSIVQQLLQLTECILSSDELAQAETVRDKIKPLIRRLGRQAEELDVNLQPFFLEVCQLYNNFVQTRMELLDVMSGAGQG